MLDDFFIMDSFGWVFYCQGNLFEVLKMFEKVYVIRFDLEIVVYLGEVLWVLECKDEV